MADSNKRVPPGGQNDPLQPISMRSLKGILPKLTEPKPVEAMDEAIRNRAVSRDAESGLPADRISTARPG